MNEDSALPKYALIVQVLQRRIEAGEYPPGSMLPSEAQLVREFAIGRTTVVRALQMLRSGGWIDREHGRGSFVKNRLRIAAQTPRLGLSVLDQPEAKGLISPVRVSVAEAPKRVAALMDLPDGAPLVRRSWNRFAAWCRAGLEEVTCWYPPHLAEGSALAGDEPLQVGIRAYLSGHHGVRVDHVIERLAAQRTGAYGSQLGLEAEDALLVALMTMHDAACAPLFATEVAMSDEVETVYGTSG